MSFTWWHHTAKQCSDYCFTYYANFTDVQPRNIYGQNAITPGDHHVACLPFISSCYETNRENEQMGRESWQR